MSSSPRVPCIFVRLSLSLFMPSLSLCMPVYYVPHSFIDPFEALRFPFVRGSKSPHVLLETSHFMACEYIPRMDRYGCNDTRNNLMSWKGGRKHDLPAKILISLQLIKDVDDLLEGLGSHDGLDDSLGKPMFNQFEGK